jgi:hypothetical protein
MMYQALPVNLEVGEISRNTPDTSSNCFQYLISPPHKYFQECFGRIFILRTDIYILMADEPSSEREIRRMNNKHETQYGSGSLDSLAQQLKAVTGTWPPSAEVLEKHQAEKANLQFQTERYRWERGDRKMTGLKERARQTIQRNRDGLV